MRISRRSGMALAMCAPALLLVCLLAAYKLGGAGTAVAAIRFPQDDPELLPQPAQGGTRGPAALLFAPGGRTLYVAEQDENDIAVIDADAAAPVDHFPTGGAQPTALALSTDGKTMVVCNTFSGSVSIIDIAGRTVRSQIALPGEPCGAAITGTGIAFVSVGQLDQVAVIDTAAGKILTRIPVGHRPRTLQLASDGATLYCANRTGGTLSIIDTLAGKETARITLPVTNLRGMALAPDGSHLYVTGQQPHNDIPTDRPEGVWSNVLMSVRLQPQSATVEHVMQLDQPDRGAADPTGVALAGGDYAYVALSGTHEVLCVPLASGLTESQRSAGTQRVHVGANPRAVALRSGGAELWVGNHLANSLSVISRAPGNNTPGALRQVDLGPPTPTPDRRLKGRYLFTSAHIVRGRHFSCDSCHPEGGTDGLSWKLSHVKEAPAVRNTKDLRGNLLLTAPYGWTSREEDFEVFVEDEVSGLLKTRLLHHPEVHALWDLVNETPLPANPYRSADGSLTPAARRGEALFTGTAGCARCHVGEMHGGSERHEWVGTTPQGLKLDVPHLAGAYESAPYLHDGRAATLEEIFTKYNPAHAHGQAHSLNPEQLSDLLEFVREL